VALAIVLLVVGASVLTVGAEAAIRGAGRLATARGVSPFMLGAVLFGIDLESLGAALTASGRGQPSLAAGEAFGTILFLFSAGFAVALLIAKRPIEAPSAPMVLLPAGALLFGAAALYDQTVDRGEGLLLVAAYVVYVIMVVRDARIARIRGEAIRKEAAEGPSIPSGILLALGLVLVFVGASTLVEGGVRILDRTSLAAGFVGAALIGALASADEVLLEVLPVLRGMPDLATGNLFGTVAAFSTGALGLAALVRPLRVDTAASTAFIAVAVLYTVVAVSFLARGRAGRATGLVVIALYALWLAFASTT
jgi:cation:H+ antiporter